MHMLKCQVVFILVFAVETAANIPSLIQRGFGSCTFVDNGTCGYEVNTPWGTHKGSFLLNGRTLLEKGQDDDFYAVFIPPSLPGNPHYSMTSPLLPGVEACLSFYYIIPAATAQLHVRASKEDNVTVELWNVSARAIKNWTRSDRMFLDKKLYKITFDARLSSLAYVGVDNITTETFTCLSGFQVVSREIEAYCGNTGAKLPSCEPIDCGPLQVPPNGIVPQTTTTYGSMAIVSCQTGYHLYGSNTSTCDSRGNWTNTGQNCTIVDCGPLHVPPNGTVSQTTTTYGAKALVYCQTGYHLYGSNTVTCDSNGKWTNTGRNCTIVDCGPLHVPPYGAVSQTTTTYGAKALVSCQTGYHLYGSNTSTCDSNGKWTNTGQNCTSIDCGSLQVPPNVTVSQTTTTYGSKATISCPAGYQLYGSNTSTCDSNGKWTNTGQNCSIVDCGSLNAPLNGTVSQTTTTYGAKAIVSCPAGYQLYGSNTSTCDSNGKWTSTGQNCTIVDCGPLMAPENGNVSITTTTSGYVAEISCHTGYNLNGSMTSTCGSNGNWSSNNQRCLPVDCGRLPTPQYGNVSYTNTTFRSTAIISCQPGYNIQGSGTVICGRNGYWSSAGQQCVQVDCGPLTVPQHGNVSHTATTYGSAATISCQTGYILRGSERVTCGSNGYWSSLNQTCTLVDIDLDRAIHAGCSNIGWNISVDMSILQQMYPSIASNGIYFGATSCRGSLSRNIIQYTFGFQDCLTNEKISGEAIIYENKLVYATFDPLNPHIIRNHVWTYTIECDVVRREATSSHIHHDVNTHHSSVVVHNNISLGFYSDSSFTREIPGNPLHASVGGTIYVKVYTKVTDWSIKMRLHSCYTKPWQNSNSTLDYMLISDGCEVDANTHIISQSTHETTFMFQDFEYSGNPEGLDVYCNATFCPASDFTPTCLQACNLQP